MRRVRAAVRENRLTSTTISDADYVRAIEQTGHGWVVDIETEIVAFAVGNAETGNLWALFVHPAHERRGYGRVLHDAVVTWLWSRGVQRLWLTTDPHTRAARFYEAAGWQPAGRTEDGELLLELRRSRAEPP